MLLFVTNLCVFDPRCELRCALQVLLEFKEYAQEVDVDFVRKVGRLPCDAH